MNLRPIPILLCAVLASALSGCAAEQAAEKGQSAQAQQDAAAQTPLSGAWAVTALVDTDGKSVLTGRYSDELQVTFANGKVSGDSGCNDIFGTYTQDGADLVFSPDLGSSLVGCHEPPLLKRLLDVRHLSGAGDERYLLGADDTTIVELRRL